MADITEELNAIQTAKYGREVRGSIYAALVAINNAGEDVTAAFETLQTTVLSYKRQFTATDDIDAEAFRATGMWSSSSASTKPQNWPEGVGFGKLVTLGGSAGSTGRALKIQVIFTYSTDEIYWRMGRSDAWGAWNKLKVDDGADVAHRGYLSDSDDLDTILSSGMWTVSSQGYPANYPGTGYGKFISFGAGNDAATIAIKVQVVFKVNLQEIWYRTGKTYSGGTWSEWRQLGNGSRTTEKKYVCLGASTAVGTDGDGHISETYSTLIGKIGNFSVTNLAVGGTDFIRRSNGYTNMMDIITNPDNTAIFEAADLITIQIGMNDSLYDSQATDMAKALAHIGTPEQYYEYEYGEDYDNLKSSCTKAAACNFIIRYISQHFPHAQLVFIRAPLASRFQHAGSVTMTTSKQGTVSYNTPAETFDDSTTNYAEVMYPVIEQCIKNANLPIADASDTFACAWHNVADLYNDTKHPKTSTYDKYNMGIASAVLAIANN